MNTISEIQITPVKPNNGLVAFTSFILFDAIYCGSVAIFTRVEGGYRLVYPQKSGINIFHPIIKRIGQEIEKQVLNKFNEVMNHDRHNTLGTH